MLPTAKVVLLLFLVVKCFQSTKGYGQEAPTQACSSMEPEVLKIEQTITIKLAVKSFFLLFVYLLWSNRERGWGHRRFWSVLQWQIENHISYFNIISY